MERLVINTKVRAPTTIAQEHAEQAQIAAPVTWQDALAAPAMTTLKI